MELDKWEKKVNMAGKMVTWHAVDLDAEIVKDIKSGAITFEQAREKIKAPKNDAAAVLEGLRLAIEHAK